MDYDDDPFELQRFVDAQDQGGTYRGAVDELRRGRKQSHWMWFVFPQLRGLGSSTMAERYGIGSLDEARAYLEHPVLGRRLVECAELMAGGRGTAEAVLGPVDAVKLRSSMTLFAEAEREGDVFERVLERCFAGTPDQATLARL